ncbi:uncharacterized protein Mip isoform X2 [Dermacentor andersoni]|uniref:uncharacterized protein Mip isoform X2 n=1 Tax=Dermacentor andersoni TaxID=34620 RepID=UPI003B3AC521
MATSSSSSVAGVWMLALLVLGSLLGALAEPQAGGDWNALSGMWGKRASSDWNRLSSMWGKRGPYGPYQVYHRVLPTAASPWVASADPWKNGRHVYIGSQL